MATGAGAARSYGEVITGAEEQSVPEDRATFDGVGDGYGASGQGAGWPEDGQLVECWLLPLGSELRYLRHSVTAGSCAAATGTGDVPEAPCSRLSQAANGATTMQIASLQHLVQSSAGDCVAQLDCDHSAFAACDNRR